MAQQVMAPAAKTDKSLFPRTHVAPVNSQKLSSSPNLGSPYIPEEVRELVTPCGPNGITVEKAALCVSLEMWLCSLAY